MRSSACAPSSASGASSTGCSEILSRRKLECEDARVTDAGDSEAAGDLDLGADEAGPTTPPQPSPPPLVWWALTSSALSPLAGSVSSSSAASADNSPGLRGAFQEASKLGEGSGCPGGPGGVSHMRPLDFASVPHMVDTVGVRTDGEVLRRRPRFLSAETFCLCWRNMTSRASGEPWSGPGDLTCHDRGDTDTGTGSATSFPSPHSWRVRPCTAAPHLAQRIIPGAPAHVCQPFMMPAAGRLDARAGN